MDRHTKRGIMLACDVARVLIIGWVPLAWALGVLTLWQLYVVALTAGVATVFFDVSYQSYLPVLLKPESLMDGNGKLGATQAFAQFTGPGLGGGLVGAVGAATAMWADAISYVVSVASLFGIRTREQRVETPPEHRNLRAEIAEGLKFVVRHPILRKIVACTGTSNLFSSMSTAIEIVFLIRVLHVHPAYTGLLFAISAIGGIAGGVFAGRLARRIGSARIIWFSILVFGLPQFLPALAEPGWLVALFPIGYATLVLLRRGLQRRAGQLPPGGHPAAADGPDERGRPVDRVGHHAARRHHRRRARLDDRDPPHAVDRLRRQLGRRLLGLLLPAPQNARHPHPVTARPNFLSVR